MLKTQLGSMQEQTRTIASQHGFSTRPFDVDLFAANRVAELAQMDADLMCASCFQPARKESKTRQALQHAYMGDRLFPGARRATAAPAVASIACELRTDHLRLHPPGD